MYLPQIQPMVGGIVDNQTAVKDVLQDIFLLLWVDRAKLAGVDVPRNWIFRITCYQCYKYLRKQSVRTKAQQRLLDEAREEPLGNSTEEYTAFEETSRLVRQAVIELPPQAQKIYRMRRE